MQWDSSDFDSVVDGMAARLVFGQQGAARAAATYLMALSQSKTPVETGNLRASHDVKVTGVGSAEITVAGPYARYQHFGLDFRHETGQALYLEMALIEGAHEALAIMADYLS